MASTLGRDTNISRWRQSRTRYANKDSSITPTAQKICMAMDGSVRCEAGNTSVIITYALSAIPYKHKHTEGTIKQCTVKFVYI